MSSYGSHCLTVEDVPCTITRWIWRVVPILLLLVGTPGNVLSIVVLSRKNLRSKPIFLLMFLAIFDLTALWSLLLLRSLQLGYNLNLNSTSLVLCLLCNWMLFSSGCSSVITVSVFTMERLLSVYFPIKYKALRIKSKSRNVLIIAVLLIWSLIGLDVFSNYTNSPARHKIIGRFTQTNRSDFIESNKSNNWSDFTNLNATYGSDLTDSDATNGSDLTDSNVTYGSGFTKPKTSHGSDFSRLNATKGSNCTDSNGILRSKGMDDSNRPTPLGSDFTKSSNPFETTLLNNTSMTTSSVCWSPSYDYGPTGSAIYVSLVSFAIAIPSVLCGNAALLFKLYARPAVAITRNDPQTAILFMITGLFVITVLPGFVFIFIIYPIMPAELASVSSLLYAIVICISAINCTLNFVCYIWKCRPFKAEIGQIWKEIKGYSEENMIDLFEFNP